MYLYNVSVIIEPSVHIPVVTWIENLLRQQNNENLHFLQMLDSPHDGYTYCLQLIAQKEEEIATFKSSTLSKLQQFIANEHTDKAFVFDSTMKYLKQ